MVAKRPTKGYRPMVPAEQPAPRNFEYERLICGAMRTKRSLQFRDEGDVYARTFNPHVIWPSPKRKMLLSGVMVINPNDPTTNGGWRSFEVGKLRALVVTDNFFEPNRDFDSRAGDYPEALCAVDRV